MDLQIDFGETRNISSQVKTKGEDFKSLLTKINEINNQLQNYWQGQDASKYSTAVEQQAKVMDELQKKIDEIAKFLSEVANAYEKTAEANANAIKTN